MENRYQELTPVEQDTVNRLVNSIAASKGLLDTSRTCGDLDRVIQNLNDRTSLQMYRNADAGHINIYHCGHPLQTLLNRRLPR